MYNLNQLPIYGVVFPIARIHGSRNPAMEMGVTLLTITPSDPLVKFLLPVPMTLLCFAGLKVLGPKEGMLLPVDVTIIPLKWKLRLLPGHFRFLMPLTQSARKGVLVMVGVIDSDYQWETDLLNFHCYHSYLAFNIIYF